MRHRIAHKNLQRTTAHSVAMRRNLVTALFEHGQITTTAAKARHVQAFAEKLITLARKNTLHARRLVIARMQDRNFYSAKEPDQFLGTAVRKLFDEIAPKYADRSGGYTRIIRTDKRRIGDGGALVVLQLVDAAAPARKKPTSVTPRRRRASARYALAERASGKAKASRAKAEQDEPAAEAESPASEPSADEPSEPKDESK